MALKLVEGKYLEKKRAKKQCIVHGCTNYKSPRGLLCTKHEHEMRKEKNPHQYYFASLRRNAKRRGKVFTITLEYFIEFYKETGYVDKKGRKSGCMTIDRKIDELGYIEGNLQIMEVGYNSRKRFVDYWIRQEQSWVEPPIDVSDIVPVKSSRSNEPPPF